MIRLGLWLMALGFMWGPLLGGSGLHTGLFFLIGLWFFSIGARLNRKTSS